jgi:hypothetical protein
MPIIKNLTSARLVLPGLGITLNAQAAKPVTAAQAAHTDVQTLRSSGNLSLMADSEFAVKHGSRHSISGVVKVAAALKKEVAVAKKVQLPAEAVPAPAEAAAEGSPAPTTDVLPDAPAVAGPEENLEKSEGEDLLSITNFRLLKKEEQIDYLKALGIDDADSSTKKALEDAYEDYLSAK